MRKKQAFRQAAPACQPLISLHLFVTIFSTTPTTTSSPLSVHANADLMRGSSTQELALWLSPERNKNNVWMRWREWLLQLPSDAMPDADGWAKEE